MSDVLNSDRYVLPKKVVIQSDSTDDKKIFEKLIDFTKKGFTYIFDRGFYTIEVLDKIADSLNYFITRMLPTYKVTLVKEIKIKKSVHKHMTVMKDQMVRIGSRKKSKNIFRLITIVTESQEEFKFLTNRFDLDGFEVCQIYRLRWEIETLFKWLKQYMKINKLISRSENGVLVQIYMALIIHLLILQYAKLHGFDPESFSMIEVKRTIRNQIINEILLLAFLLGFVFGSTHPPSNKSKLDALLNLYNGH